MHDATVILCQCDDGFEIALQCLAKLAELLCFRQCTLYANQRAKHFTVPDREAA